LRRFDCAARCPGTPIVLYWTVHMVSSEPWKFSVVAQLDPSISITITDR